MNYSLSRKSARIWLVFVITSLFLFFSFPSSTNAVLDGSGSSLVGWWKLNEGSLASSTDSTGNGHTGTVTGNPTYTSGQLNGAISFDAIDDKIAINDFTEADNTTTLTVSAWVQPSVSASTSAFSIVSKTRTLGGFSGWYLSRNASEKYEFYVRDGSGAATASSDTTFADTSMHHVVGVYNGTDVKVYVDGVSADATPASFTGTLLNGTQKVCIGQSNGASGICDGASNTFFAGIIDDVRIYNRELSSTEIAQLYNNGIAGIETVTSPTVTTSSASSVTSTTANANGSISSTGGDPVTVRGFAYGLTTSYGATTTENGSFSTGSFTASLSSLTCNTTYHVRAYSTNSLGTGYGSDSTFTTSTCSAVTPTVSTSAASSITSTSTTLNGSITDTGNENETVRGFAYGVTTSYGATTTENGSFSTGSFSSSVGSLSCNTLYHFRGYATNSAGTGYGSDTTFTTSTCSPTVTSFTIPTTATAVTISISSFVAMDNIGVTGYLITETATTPSSSDSGWSATPQTSYTFRTSGHKTLYAWAKDASNNISASASDTIVISLSEYTPPVGIPDPSDSFGTFGEINKATPDWPASWETPSTSATAGYYFIDNSDGACTNTSNTYGHPDTPRCDPPEGSLAEGTYLYFNGGTYTPALSGGDRYDWYGLGTASNPIWISGNPDSQPVFTEKVYLGYGGNSSYIVFENMTMTGASASIAVQPLTDGHDIDHVLIRNITRTGTESDGDQGAIQMGISQSNDTLPNSQVSYVVVYDVNISNIGYIGPLSVGGDETGVYMGYHTDHFWVLDSIIHDVGADSVAGSHYSNDTDRLAEYYFIGRNILYQNGENCIDLKTINHAIISQNTCYGPFQDENGWGIVVHYGANSLPTKDAWALFNKVYDAGGGIISTFGENLHFIGNEIYNVHATSTDSLDGACFGYRSTSLTMDIIDNTCYDYDIGVSLPNGLLSSGDDVNIYGNIFSSRASSTQYEIKVSGSSENQYVDMDYNQFYKPSGSAAFYWGGASRTLTYMQSTASECANCIESDPLFTDASGSDFTLQNSSPAKNVSVEHGSYDDFYSIYTLNIEKDLLGIARPQGGLWDMGAYEYVESDTIAPTLSSGSPTTEQPAGTTQVTLSVTTNESATCKYGTTSGTVYASVANTFTTTGGTTHSSTITGLSNGTSYTYYIRCIDSSSNANSSDYTISFSITSPAVSSGGGSSSSSSSSSGGNGGPVGSFGQTNSNGANLTYLQNQVNLLTIKLNNLLALKEKNPITNNSYTFTRNLSLHTTGEDVRQLQKYLNSHGFPISGTGPGSIGKETTLFGTQTYKALTKFQASVGIPASGFFGPITRAWIQNNK